MRHDRRFRWVPFIILTILATAGLVSASLWGSPGQAAPLQDLGHSEPSTLVPAAYLPLVARNYVVPAPLWRFGAAKARRSVLDYAEPDIAGLRLGWYVDWTVTPNAPRPYGMEYMPIVRVKQWKLASDSTWTTCCVGCPYVQVGGQYTYTVSPDWSVIRAAAQADRGMLWVIGNEIERVDWGSGYCARQDEMLPEVYAIAYHEIREAILNVDPTARFAIGGVIQATPLRLEYLRRVWEAYQKQYGERMPIDVWNVHAFVLQEKRGSWGADIPAGMDSIEEGKLYTILDNRDFSIAWGHIRALRTWMKEIGEQNKPLIITEYGVNMPPHFDGFSPEEVRDYFMYPSFEHFLNQTDQDIGYPADGYRLVQRWNWYSLDDDSGKYEGGEYYQFFNGNLLYSGLGANPMGLSPLGRYWQEYVRSLPQASEPPYALEVSRAESPTSEIGVRSTNAIESVSCDGQRIRLVFTEPSPAGASFWDHGTEASRVVKEEWHCLPSHSLSHQ